MPKSPINKNIYILGFVSLFTDISSEMIYPLLPIFLSSTLGVSTAFIGLLEGIAESAASIIKTFSGWFSDKLKKRKPLILCGYSLSAITKPFLSLAASGWNVLSVRFIDRIGKGIRVSPRDALVAESCLPNERGKAFGIQRAMDNLGACLGPLAAFLLLPIFNNNYRAIFLLSFIPALAAVMIIFFFLKEKNLNNSSEGTAQISNAGLPIKGNSFKSLSPKFKIFLLIVAVFTMGNSSNAFLILRARNFGVSVILIPILWLVYNFIGSISAVPFGRLSDIIGRRKIIIIGFLIYSFVYFGFAFSKAQYQIWMLMAIYGIYNGITEGVLRAHVADLITDSSKRATAYGIFNTAEGIFILPASVLMGVFWQAYGAPFAFSFGASLALAAAAIFWWTQA